MYVGRSPDQPPTENTLEVNITHEILQQIREVFEKAVAVNPSRGEEGDFGYDISVDWDWLKIFALQFKTFHNKGSIRLNGYHTEREYYKYELNKEQHKQLMYHFPLPRMAFYTLPIFSQRKDLNPPLLDQKFICIDISRDEYEIIEFPQVIFIDVILYQPMPPGYRSQQTLTMQTGPFVTVKTENTTQSTINACSPGRKFGVVFFHVK